MTTSANVKVSCIINGYTDTVTLTSPTGTSLTVGCLKMVGGYDAFNDAEKSLLLRLIKVTRNRGTVTLPLSYDEMRTFKAAAERTAPAKSAPAPADVYHEHVAHKAAFAAHEAAQERAAYEAEMKRDEAYGEPETYREDEADDMDQYAEQEEHPRRFVMYTSKNGRTFRYLVVEEYTDTIMYGFRKGQRVKCVMLKPTAWVGDAFSVPASKCQPCND